MFLRGELGEKDVPDNSLPVDDVGHASGEPESCRDAIALSEQAIGIAQQDEGKLVRCGELLVRLHRVRTDADHFGSGSLEEFITIAKGTRFGGADRGVIFGVEVQHHRRLPEQLSQADECACLAGERKVRGRVTHLHLSFCWLRLVVMHAHDEISFLGTALYGWYRNQTRRLVRMGHQIVQVPGINYHIFSVESKREAVQTPWSWSVQEFTGHIVM